MKLFEFYRQKDRAAFYPYYFGDQEPFVLMMIPSDPMYGGSEPQVAKGTIEKGESPKNTAIREVHEELGLRPDNFTNFRQVGTTNIDEPDYGVYKVTLFIAEVLDPDNLDDPHWETGWSGWLPLSEAKRRVEKYQARLLSMLENAIG